MGDPSAEVESAPDLAAGIVWRPAPPDLSGARPIKTREGREVLETSRYVAKRYRVRGLAKRLAVTIRGGGKGRREWDLLVEANRRAIPIPRPVAYGARRQGGLIVEEWIVSERIDGARDLAEVAREADLGAAVPPSQRRPWIDRLAALVACCHDAGLSHDDLHPGNVLVAGRDLVLVDLDGARLGPPLEPADRIASLSVLARFFWQRSTRTDRLRFLVAYAGDEFRSLAGPIEARTRADAIRFWRRRVRRYTRPNRYVARLASGRLAGWLDRDHEGWGFLDSLSDLDRFIAGGEVFKSSRSSTVARCLDPRTGEPLFVKRVEPRLAKTIASLFRPTKAIRAWRGAWRLVMRGLPTPPPVAVLEERLGPFVRAQYLVTREVAPSAGLDRVLDRFPLPDLARSVGRALRLLAERGLEHGDLKPANILVHTRPDGRPEIHLIDLESLRDGGAPGRGLARLARWAAADPRIRRTILLRALLAHLGPPRAPRAVWKAMWRRIAAEARR